MDLERSNRSTNHWRRLAYAGPWPGAVFVLWLILAFAADRIFAETASSANRSTYSGVALEGDRPARSESSVTRAGEVVVEGPMIPLAPDRGVVVYLSDASPALAQYVFNERSAGRVVKGAGQAPIPVDDPRFLDRLRWHLLPVLETAPALEGELACPEEETFSDSVSAVETALNFLEHEKAAMLVEQAWKNFECGGEVAQAESLARFFFFQGVLDVYRGQPRSPYLATALSIQPFLNYHKDYPEKVRKAVDVARERLFQTEQVRVHFATGSLAGMGLWVDGVEVTGGSGLFVVGEHVLQVVEPGGQAVAGARVLLEATAAADLAWPPAALRPPAGGAVLARLTRGVKSGELDAGLQNTVESFLVNGGFPWLLLVSATNDDQAVEAVWALPGQRYYTEPGLPSPRALRDAGYDLAGSGSGGRSGNGAKSGRGAGGSRVGVALTATAGAVTLASAAWYGYLVYQYHPTLGQGDARDEDQQQKIHRMSGISGFGALGGLVATITAASLTWKIPGALYSSGQSPGSSVELRLAAGPSGAGLRLSGRF